MIHGFDLDSPLVCEGIIGDGCGGGRLFFIKENSLRAYDPQSKNEMFLLEEVYEAKQISKSGCKIFIDCMSGQMVFDLSLMTKITSEI
jgi:hypothetical protein